MSQSNIKTEKEKKKSLYISNGSPLHILKLLSVTLHSHLALPQILRKRETPVGASRRRKKHGDVVSKFN